MVADISFDFKRKLCHNRSSSIRLKVHLHHLGPDRAVKGVQPIVSISCVPKLLPATKLANAAKTMEKNVETDINAGFTRNNCQCFDRRFLA